MPKDKIYCYGCLYTTGEKVEAIYLTLVLGSDERWGSCLKHYDAPCNHKTTS